MDTLVERFQRTVEQLGPAVALRQAGRPDLSWSELSLNTSRLAGPLARLGVGPGRTAALITRNTIDFHVLDLALLRLGATPFSVSGAEPPERVREFLGAAECDLLLVDDAHLDLARAVGVDAAKAVVVIDGDRAAGREIRLGDLSTSSSGAPEPEIVPDAEAIATLIFTSGTTGVPKAVQLSHRAIVSSLDAFDALAPYGAGDDVFISYLPLSHIAERFMTYYSTLAFGGSIHCVTDADTLYAEIARVRPTRFFGVPRVYDKLAVRAKESLAAHGSLTEAARNAQARADLGFDRARYLGVATAPSSRETLDFFMDIGLPVGDIWGLSEAIMCTANPVGGIRPGSVGVFLDGVEGRVAEDGELLVRGRNVFSGYRGDPARTAELVDADGWLHSGDLGAIDADGYLRILGRKKEMMITATGKNLLPAVIEATVKNASALIDHVVSIADGRRFVTALIALDREELARFAAVHAISGSFGELTASPAVHEAIAAAVDSANARLSRPESVRNWRICPIEWVPGGDEITTTMKLRRGEIAHKYAAEIEALYE